MRHFTLPLLLLLIASCDGDPSPLDAGQDADPGEDCPSHTEALASPGDPIDGDTWDTFARGFFEQHCTGCHASTLTGDARRGAPEGFDWDRESSVREHVTAIRSAVGVTNFMPPEAPKPSCDERARLVRWIDADAP